MTKKPTPSESPEPTCICHRSETASLDCPVHIEMRKSAPSGKNESCGLTYAQLEVACSNVGVDISCPDCAMTFFTGFTGPTDRHDFIPSGHPAECKTESRLGQGQNKVIRRVLADYLRCSVGRTLWSMSDVSALLEPLRASLDDNLKAKIDGDEMLTRLESLSHNASISARDRQSVQLAMGLLVPSKPETAREFREWDEFDGDVLWWKLPVVEPPYVGTPLDDDFPDYVTHWTKIVVPQELVGEKVEHPDASPDDIVYGCGECASIGLVAHDRTRKDLMKTCPIYLAERDKPRTAVKEIDEEAHDMEEPMDLEDRLERLLNEGTKS